jgi:membrane protease YdiL (CAAX protease family)/galactitol-specific phosphotransferase system IIB component
MPNREKQIAAALFIITALSFPIIFRGAATEPPTERMGRFMVRSAILKMKLESALRVYDPPVADETIEVDETAAEEEVDGLDLFTPITWLEATAEMTQEERKPILSQIAVACLAMGLDEEAQKFVETGKLTFESHDPFAELLGAGTTADHARFTHDLEASSLPEWTTLLALERYTLEGDSGGPTDERVGEVLTPWATRTSLLFGILLIAFLAGLILLALSPRILASFRRPDSILERSMFGAPPLYTYLLFAAWFTLPNAIAWLLLPTLKSSMSAASVLLIGYLISAVVGVFLVTRRGMMRTENVFVAVDLDGTSASPRNLAMGLVGYLVAVPVVAFLTLFSSVLLGGGEEGLNPAIPVLIDAGSGADFYLLVFNVAVLAPLFEEFLFRGFFFQQFRRFYSLPNAILLSAAIFAAVHLSIESFLPLFGLGVLLATVYHTTRSLWAAVITHALWNLGTVLAVTVLFSS